jgi:O-antigen/teichoic acid export membrane protein
LGGRAAIISLTRLLNRGLLLISPIVLVRLLSVEDFGRYREFLLYTTILLNFAALGISSSLLRFIPERPELKWRYVQQTLLMTLSSSAVVSLAAFAIDVALDGKAMGEFALPVVIYVLLFVNFDFWEYLWLAEKRSLAVLAYTTGRLLARMATVITAAALTSNVTVIIWSIVALEAVRLVVSSICWRRRAHQAEMHATTSWRDHLAYCLPYGGSMILTSLNASLGSLFITKALGAAALAIYAIGTYVQPIISILRNSLSDVLLPEMVSRARHAQSDRLDLFRRTTIVTAIALFAAAIVLGRFAELVIVTVFSEEYRSAALVMQLFLISFLRECADFGVPLRAINRTAPIMRSNLIALTINLGLLTVLLPRWGLLGAVTAFVISRFADGLYLGHELKKAYAVGWSEIVAWRDLGKVAAAALIAAGVLFSGSWVDALGVVGAVISGALYVLSFGTLLVLFRVPEAATLLERLGARASRPRHVNR